MQKANVTVLVVVVLVIAAIFTAEWYFFDHLPRKAEYELEGAGPLPEASNLSGDTSSIIECEDPEAGKYYTDAKNCDEAEAPVPGELPKPKQP